MFERPFTGGCLCGAIRYEIDAVFDVIYCHCNHCRRSSGAPVLLTAQVSGDAFRLTKGSPSEHRTSDSGRSFFCGTCGTGLYGEYAPPNHPLVREGRYFSVRVGTLDDPERVRPQIHQFVENKLSWFDTTDNLPRVEGNTLPHPDKRSVDRATAKLRTCEINERLIEQIHGAFAAGRHPATNLFAPDAVWHVEGSNPLARNYEGRDAVFAAFRAYEQYGQGTLRVRLVSVTANDEYALAILQATGERAGRPYKCLEYDVYRISNGAVAEFWSFSSNQRATDAFWSQRNPHDQGSALAITLRQLVREEIAQIWNIDRSEVIENLYHLRDGSLVLRLQHVEVSGWPTGEAEKYTPILRHCFDRGGWFYGAFDDERLIGTVVLESNFIGRDQNQLQLKFLHVSRSYRNRGLGAKLFELAKATARERGATRLYISATPSENTINFYRRLGCVVAKDPDPELFELEPEDIHLQCEI
jgi:predicted N-acetyltransferase YhbS/ketosteroid isomerase-like protein